MSGQMLPMSTDLGSQRFLKGKSIVVIGRWILLWLPGIGLGGLWFTVRVDWAVDAHAVLGSLNVKPDLLLSGVARSRSQVRPDAGQKP